MSCYIDPSSALSWDALFPYVGPYARGAPEEIMAHNIRLSTIEFCRRSGVLHDVQKYDLQGYVEDYQLTTDCNYQIIRIFRVQVNQWWTYVPVTQKLPNRGVGAFLFYASSPTMIHLRRPPAIDNPQGLEVETIVTPTQDSCVLENYLYEKWAEDIGYGAIARLLKIPQTNWFDSKLASDYEIKARRGIARARAEIDRSFATTSTMRTQMWVGPGKRGWGGGYHGGNWC